MNHELARKVADAVLYEGYMLYPYRPSAIKNRQRWSFGILYPSAYPEVLAGTERSQMHSECLLKTADKAVVHIELRFLHLIARQIEREAAGQFEPVSSLSVDGRLIESWEEGIARSAYIEAETRAQKQVCFSFSGCHEMELLRTRDGQIAGRLSRVQCEVGAMVSLRSEMIRDGIFKLTIDVSNTALLPPDELERSSALLRSLLSVHSILTVTGGEFISLLEPPDDLRELSGQCINVGNFPVLVGEEGERDMMLCSPVILYDYPQIAPESAGDFYDATEMDEMLTLRVMTLTDEEKDEMRQAGSHVRDLLRRTEENAREQLMRTHGTIRGLRPVVNNHE